VFQQNELVHRQFIPSEAPNFFLTFFFGRACTYVSYAKSAASKAARDYIFEWLFDHVKDPTRA